MSDESETSYKFSAGQGVSYFLKEWKVLLAVAISGLIYNIGLLAGPWFEGKIDRMPGGYPERADQFSEYAGSGAGLCDRHCNCPDCQVY